MAGEPGFEPGLTESESVVLPLYYSPKALLINDLAGHQILLYLLQPFVVPLTFTLFSDLSEQYRSWQGVSCLL